MFMDSEKSFDDVRASAQKDIQDLRGKITQLDKDSLDLILTKARSHYAWQDRPVEAKNC